METYYTAEIVLDILKGILIALVSFSIILVAFLLFIFCAM